MGPWLREGAWGGVETVLCLASRHGGPSSSFATDLLCGFEYRLHSLGLGLPICIQRVNLLVSQVVPCSGGL
jgi:hypothetical protein